jgi:putative FmdB family regulatory protein
MPIYEYRCPQCGEKFEKLVRLGSNAEVRCPRCDSDKPERMISLVAHTSAGSDYSTSYSSSCNTST